MPPAFSKPMSDDDAFELEKLKLEYSEKDKQRRAELFKWFIMLVIGPIGNGLTIWSQHSAASAVADKVDAVAAKADVAAKTAASTNAVTLQWRAEHTGDPMDVAKAEKAEARLENAADKVP